MLLRFNRPRDRVEACFDGPSIARLSASYETAAPALTAGICSPSAAGRIAPRMPDEEGDDEPSDPTPAARNHDRRARIWRCPKRKRARGIDRSTDPRPDRRRSG